MHSGYPATNCCVHVVELRVGHIRTDGARTQAVHLQAGGKDENADDQERVQLHPSATTPHLQGCNGELLLRSGAIFMKLIPFICRMHLAQVFIRYTKMYEFNK